eukprot:TRINITY_DN52977_c0_g1_i1.p1 TRINITY_DN52977_c0_g1~~TRINITY_DN52977_c0_g1_i1.p1  ORF type:complete len:143 (+),score=17.07 TRINITY_DN52977_c0_g1_i1:134-562(+)
MSHQVPSNYVPTKSHSILHKSPMHCARGASRCPTCKELESTKDWVLCVIDEPGDGGEEFQEAREIISFGPRKSTNGNSLENYAPFIKVGKFSDRNEAMAFYHQHKESGLVHLDLPSYQEVHGPMPSSAVIDEEGLAVQSTGM